MAIVVTASSGSSSGTVTVFAVLSSPNWAPVLRNHVLRVSHRVWTPKLEMS